MSRTKRHTVVGSVTSPELKNEQNRLARGDKRKLKAVTLDECIAPGYPVDFGDYDHDVEILEEPDQVLDLGNDKKYKRLANEGYQYS